LAHNIPNLIQIDSLLAFGGVIAERMKAVLWPIGYLQYSPELPVNNDGCKSSYKVSKKKTEKSKNAKINLCYMLVADHHIQ